MTILSIVNGSLGIAVKIGKVIKDLYDIAQRFKHAELDILSSVEECKTIRAAWGGIERWARAQADSEVVEEELLNRLDQSLMFGIMVMSAFENDLLALASAPEPTKFLHRTKVVWNEKSFAQHQNRIRAQVGAMTLLLQVVSL